ncbi:MAG: hypothetical protein ACXVEE_14980 [Polyangiales bacterium]
MIASPTREAAANPPPPKTLPDPPLTAPTRAETPSVVRRHAGICFAFFPSGGTLAVECPKELLNEPVGEALVKQPSGRCQFVPFTSGSPGRTGYVDKCPMPFDVVAEPGVIPEWSKKLAVERRAPTGEDEPSFTPMPARLGEAPPQEVGCGIAPPRAAASSLGAAGIAAALCVRRRKR